MVDEKKQLIHPTANVVDKLMSIIVLLIFVAVLAPSYIFLISPQLEKILPGGDVHRQTAEEILSKRTKYLVALKPLQELYDAYGPKSESNLIESIAPSSIDIPTLYALFERLGRELNVSIQTIDIGSVESASSGVKDIESVIVSLKFAGITYEKTKEILSTLESNLRLTDVMVIDYDPRSKFLSLTMRLYYFAQKK